MFSLKGPKGFWHEGCLFHLIGACPVEASHTVAYTQAPYVCVEHQLKAVSVMLLNMEWKSELQECCVCHFFAMFFLLCCSEFYMVWTMMWCVVVIAVVLRAVYG